MDPMQPQGSSRKRSAKDISSAFSPESKPPEYYFPERTGPDGKTTYGAPKRNRHHQQCDNRTGEIVYEDADLKASGPPSSNTNAKQGYPYSGQLVGQTSSPDWQALAASAFGNAGVNTTFVQPTAPALQHHQESVETARGSFAASQYSPSPMYTPGQGRPQRQDPAATSTIPMQQQHSAQTQSHRYSQQAQQMTLDQMPILFQPMMSSSYLPVPQHASDAYQSSYGTSANDMSTGRYSNSAPLPPMYPAVSETLVAPTSTPSPLLHSPGLPGQNGIVSTSTVSPAQQLANSSFVGEDQFKEVISDSQYWMTKFRQNCKEQAVLGSLYAAPIVGDLMMAYIHQKMPLIPRDFHQLGLLPTNLQMQLVHIFTAAGYKLLRNDIPYQEFLYTWSLLKSFSDTIVSYYKAQVANIENKGFEAVHKTVATYVEALISSTPSLSGYLNSPVTVMPFKNIPEMLGPHRNQMTPEQHHWLLREYLYIKKLRAESPSDVGSDVPQEPFKGSFNNDRGYPYRIDDLLKMRSHTLHARLSHCKAFQGVGNAMLSKGPSHPEFQDSWNWLLEKSREFWNQECDFYAGKLEKSPEDRKKLLDKKIAVQQMPPAAQGVSTPALSAPYPLRRTTSSAGSPTTGGQQIQPQAQSHRDSIPLGASEPRFDQNFLEVQSSAVQGSKAATAVPKTAILPETDKVRSPATTAKKPHSAGIGRPNIAPSKKFSPHDGNQKSAAAPLGPAYEAPLEFARWDNGGLVQPDASRAAPETNSVGKPTRTNRKPALSNNKKRGAPAINEDDEQSGPIEPQTKRIKKNHPTNEVKVNTELDEFQVHSDRNFGQAGTGVNSPTTPIDLTQDDVEEVVQEPKPRPKIDEGLFTKHNDLFNLWEGDRKKYDIISRGKSVLSLREHQSPCGLRSHRRCGRELAFYKLRDEDPDLEVILKVTKSPDADKAETEAAVTGKSKGKKKTKTPETVLKEPEWEAARYNVNHERWSLIKENHQTDADGKYEHTKTCNKCTYDCGCLSDDRTGTSSWKDKESEIRKKIETVEKECKETREACGYLLLETGEWVRFKSRNAPPAPSEASSRIVTSDGVDYAVDGPKSVEKYTEPDWNAPEYNIHHENWNFSTDRADHKVLPNGNFECSHSCPDKKKCNHSRKCCGNGVEWSSKRRWITTKQANIKKLTTPATPSKAKGKSRVPAAGNTSRVSVEGQESGAAADEASKVEGHDNWETEYENAVRITHVTYRGIHGTISLIGDKISAILWRPDNSTEPRLRVPLRNIRLARTNKDCIRIFESESMDDHKTFKVVSDTDNKRELVNGFMTTYSVWHKIALENASKEAAEREKRREELAAQQANRNEEAEYDDDSEGESSVKFTTLEFEDPSQDNGDKIAAKVPVLEDEGSNDLESDDTGGMDSDDSLVELQVPQVRYKSEGGTISLIDDEEGVFHWKPDVNAMDQDPVRIRVADIKGMPQTSKPGSTTPFIKITTEKGDFKFFVGSSSPNQDTTALKDLLSKWRLEYEQERVNKLC